jgi:hypothetical protein
MAKFMALPADFSWRRFLFAHVWRRLVTLLCLYMAWTGASGQSLANRVAPGYASWVTQNTVRWALVVVGILGLLSFYLGPIARAQAINSKTFDPPPVPPVYSAAKVGATFDYGDGVLRLGVENGNQIIRDATLNFLVPSSLKSIDRVTKNNGRQLTTSEPLDGVDAIYWAESGLHFPGRVSTLIEFVLGNPLPGRYSAICRIVTDEFAERLNIQGSFVIPHLEISLLSDEDEAPAAMGHTSEVRQVLNEQLAELSHQRELAYEWRTVKAPNSGLNEVFNWNHRKAVLHGDARYSKVYHAIATAWLSLGRLERDKTQHHKDDAVAKIDAAIVEIRTFDVPSGLARVELLLREGIELLNSIPHGVELQERSTYDRAVERWANEVRKSLKDDYPEWALHFEKWKGWVFKFKYSSDSLRAQMESYAGRLSQIVVRIKSGNTWSDED